MESTAAFKQAHIQTSMESTAAFKKAHIQKQGLPLRTRFA
jgi:hypothetical protein